MAKDIYHYIVKEALEREHWVVVSDPFIMKSKRLKARLEIDLELEQILIAEKQSADGVRKILVEVKSFLRPSLVHELHSVIGQYFNYSIGVEELAENYDLYLAIPIYAYEKLIEIGLFNVVVERLSIKIIVFNPATKTITLWKE